MKVKVVRTYVDKYTDFLHEKNTEIEITKERFNEISASGVFVEEIKVTKKKKVTK